MTRVDDHRAALAGLTDWRAYLAEHSGLPGPRGNLELVAACGEEASVERAEELIATGDEFATVCGLVALGRHFGGGDDSHVALLHRHASDARWRVREGVAMALQRAGDDDLERSFTVAERFAADPDPLVRRAAVAAVCEPRLLRNPVFARRALALLERVTAGLAAGPIADRRSAGVRTLRRALGYGWSVVVAALPAEGLPAFALLHGSEDPDVAWVVRENNKKARLKRAARAGSDTTSTRRAVVAAAPRPAVTDRADEVVARLRLAYESAADAERAAGASAYMRNQFAFLGVPTPERRRLTRAALRDLPDPDEPQLAGIVRALWAQPEREFQHTGCDYLREHVAVATAGFIDVVHELVTTKAWWDTVDALAAHTAGPLVRAHPELVATMDRWAGADTLWVARTALLHQLTYKEATDAERLFRYCRLRAGDREFFIRKAIGWALRSYAASAPDAVERFVAETPELSPLSVREATRGIARARR